MQHDVFQVAGLVHGAGRGIQVHVDLVVFDEKLVDKSPVRIRPHDVAEFVLVDTEFRRALPVRLYSGDRLRHAQSGRRRVGVHLHAVPQRIGLEKGFHRGRKQLLEITAGKFHVDAAAAALVAAENGAARGEAAHPRLRAKMLRQGIEQRLRVLAFHRDRDEKYETGRGKGEMPLDGRDIRAPGGEVFAVGADLAGDQRIQPLENLFHRFEVIARRRKHAREHLRLLAFRQVLARRRQEKQDGQGRQQSQGQHRDAASRSFQQPLHERHQHVAHADTPTGHGAQRTLVMPLGDFTVIQKMS